MAKEKSESTEIKTVTPSRPLWGPNLIENEMDRMYRDFWKGPRFSFGWPEELVSRNRDLGFLTPKIEMYEDKNDVVVKAELPGINKEDLEVNLQENILTIRGEKKSEEEEKKKGYYYSERSYGSFERSFEIPEKVLSDKIKASFQDGILEIRLEKSEEAKRKEIKIKVE
jgi:HSP20 family protein